jgi:hypothetical protein
MNPGGREESAWRSFRNSPLTPDCAKLEPRGLSISTKVIKIVKPSLGSPLLSFPTSGGRKHKICQNRSVLRSVGMIHDDNQAFGR